MANGNKINFGEQTAARLADLSVDELRSSRKGNPVNSRAAEDEDWSPPGSQLLRTRKKAGHIAPKGQKSHQKPTTQNPDLASIQKPKKQLLYRQRSSVKLYGNHPDYRLFREGSCRLF